MTASKGKVRRTIYLAFDVDQFVGHLAVSEKVTASHVIENIIKKAIEWEKVKKV